MARVYSSKPAVNSSIDGNGRHKGNTKAEFHVFLDRFNVQGVHDDVRLKPKRCTALGNEGA